MPGGAHPDGCAPVPGTKVCAVRSGEHFAETVQHRSQLRACGRGLRRDGVAADDHGGRVDGVALLLQRFAVEAAVIVHGNAAGAAVEPADVRRGLERDDIPCRIAVPLLMLLIGAIVTTVKGKKKKQQQEANEKEKRAAAYAPPMGCRTNLLGTAFR